MTSVQGFLLSVRLGDYSNRRASVGHFNADMENSSLTSVTTRRVLCRGRVDACQQSNLY